MVSQGFPTPGGPTLQVLAMCLTAATLRCLGRCGRDELSQACHHWCLARSGGATDVWFNIIIPHEKNSRLGISSILSGSFWPNPNYFK